MTSRSSSKSRSQRTPDASAHAVAPPQVARVFWSGRSQAVRLPKDFRVEESVLLISRRGKALVLEPRRIPVDEKGWPRSFWKLFGQLPHDFDLGRREEPEERSAPLGEE
jgi:antitoxin VapB